MKALPESATPDRSSTGHHHARALRSVHFVTPTPSVPPRGQGTVLLGKRLGTAVRRIRKDQALSLMDTASRAGISRAMLYHVETGQVRPSLETLVALADVLGVNPALLLEEPCAGNEDGQPVRSGQGLEVVRSGTGHGQRYHLLGALRGADKLFEPFLVTLSNRAAASSGSRHSGTEFIYLLNGSMIYRHGNQRYRMRPGDSLTFRGDIAHGPESLGKVPVRMLCLVLFQEVRFKVGR